MRISYIDGLRGVAILLVVGFHAYSRWPSLLPYGNTYEMFPLFHLGWLGVQLFFIISGFVIFMTLDKTASFNQFMYKRWMRLFPAMLLGTILIFSTSSFFYERPAGSPEILSILPGITFIEPSWWYLVFGLDIKPLEGAFWSLYVEFKFYVIAGCIYFFMGRNRLIPILLGLYLLYQLAAYLSVTTDVYVFDVLLRLGHELSLEHFGWFTSGALFYLYHENKRERFFIGALLCSVFSASFLKYIDVIVAAVMISVFFAASLRVSVLQKALQRRFILFFGFISYPLYLIHENIMISMIIKFDEYALWGNAFFYPIISLVALSIVSFLIAKKGEPLLVAYIKKTLNR